LKFVINRVGRIAEAEIELQNFTVLLGKNDSGKTYAASTIWAIVDSIKKIPAKKKLEFTPEISDFLKLLEDQDISEGNFSFEVSAEQLNSIKKESLDYLNKNIKKTLEDAIGYDGFGASKVSIEFSHENALQMHCSIVKSKETDIEKQIFENEQVAGDSEDEVFVEKTWDVEFYLSDSHGDIFSRFRAFEYDSSAIGDYLSDDIRQEIIGYSCFGDQWSKFRNVVYIPAARTGIMLALSYFVQGAVLRTERSIKEDGAALDLPAPISNFASELFRTPIFGLIKNENLLSNIIKGRFRRGKSRGAYLYTTEDSKANIPLAATSSLVTELAALSLLGHKFRRSAFLIFEEPEAHLHLEAQREMARILARLVNRGVKILITTHSDTFIQQINNLISLSRHPLKEELISELNLSKDEVIDRDAVNAYEFICRDQSTIVKSLEVSNNGFAADSLNEVLRKLADETMRISNSWPEEAEE
jgi:predicted ATPase